MDFIFIVLKDEAENRDSKESVNMPKLACGIIIMFLEDAFGK